MKPFITVVFILLTPILSIAQAKLLDVSVEGKLGDHQIEVFLEIKNSTDTYVKVNKGDVKYVLEYVKDDSTQIKETQFSIGQRYLAPGEMIKKEKFHLEIFVGGGEYKSLRSFKNEVLPTKIDVLSIKEEMKAEGYFSVTEEGKEVDMKKLGKITFLVEKDKLVANYVNGYKQDRKFTLTYNYFDLTKDGYKASASASSNVLVKVKSQESAKLGSLEMNNIKFAFLEGEYLIQPLLFKSILNNGEGNYYSFRNGDYGKYTQKFAKEPVFVSDLNKESSSNEDFLNRKID
ncbi:MAG: hypothetical protein JXR07_17430 [Reichenbachiella sp.]